MGRPFEHREHLLRVALLFAGGLVAFLLVRVLLVPEGFGVYGHFRAAALDDNRQRPLVHAGRKACFDCHSDVLEALRAGKHAQVACEACHGPLARHVEDAAAQKAERPDGRSVCLRCHQANVAKPASFPQVEVQDHSPEGPCLECHPAHSPVPK
jgi:hypothetical protein